MIKSYMHKSISLGFVKIDQIEIWIVQLFKNKAILKQKRKNEKINQNFNKNYEFIERSSCIQ